MSQTVHSRSVSRSGLGLWNLPTSIASEFELVPNLAMAIPVCMGTSILDSSIPFLTVHASKPLSGNLEPVDQSCAGKRLTIKKV